MTLSIMWQDPQTFALGFLRLDSVQTESPEDVMTITDHPVEQGANVVDHAREEPTRLSIEGMVSTIALGSSDSFVQTQDLLVPVMVPPGTKTVKLDPPQPPLALTPGGLIQAGVGALTNLVTGGPNYNGTFRDFAGKGEIKLGAQMLTPRDAAKNRVRDIYEALLRVQTARTLVTVSTRHREYFDMMIERIAKPRAVEDGSSARFQIDFKRIRVAASKTVVSPKPAEERGKGTVNKGSQAAKPANDKQAEAAFESHDFAVSKGRG